jgi:hypothetical protein
MFAPTAPVEQVGQNDVLLRFVRVVRTCKAARSIASWPIWLDESEAARSSTEMLMVKYEYYGL